MKKFRFNYSVAVWILLSLVLVLTCAGLGLNLFNLIEYSKLGAVKIALYSVIVLLNLALVVMDVSVMVYGCYVIKDGALYSNFGLIRTKSDVKDIVQISHFKKSDKLVVYFKDAKYTVIIICPEKYDDFIFSIREINPAILYESRIDGEDVSG